MEHGTILGIRVVHGRGTIRPDDGTADLPCGRDALAAGAFEELREGMWVAFAAAPDPRDPGRRHARTLRVIPA